MTILAPFLRHKAPKLIMWRKSTDLVDVRTMATNKVFSMPDMTNLAFSGVAGTWHSIFKESIKCLQAIFRVYVGLAFLSASKSATLVRPSKTLENV